MRKTRAHSRFKSDLAFLDMLFNMTISFSFLFLVAFLLIKPDATKPAVQMKAEFVLTMTWPDEALDDIDMWLLTPDGQKIMYLFKEGAYTTLDRDDRGGFNDIIPNTKGDPPIWVKVNREMMTIRAIIPGRYVVAAFVFAVEEQRDGVTSGAMLPYDVQIEMLKLNPKLVEVVKSTARLEKHHQQVTFFAFTVDADGNVTIERDTDDLIVDMANRVPE